MNPYPRLNKFLLVSGIIWWLGLGVLQATPLAHEGNGQPPYLASQIFEGEGR